MEGEKIERFFALPCHPSPPPIPRSDSLLTTEITPDLLVHRVEAFLQDTNPLLALEGLLDRVEAQCGKGIHGRITICVSASVLGQEFCGDKC